MTILTRKAKRTNAMLRFQTQNTRAKFDDKFGNFNGNLLMQKGKFDDKLSNAKGKMMINSTRKANFNAKKTKAKRLAQC